MPKEAVNSRADEVVQSIIVTGNPIYDLPGCAVEQTQSTALGTVSRL